MPSAAPDAPPSSVAHAARYDALVRWRNLFGALAAFFLVLMVVTGLADVMTTVREDRTFSVGDSPRLVLRDGVGRGLRGGIAVRAGAAGQVRVEAEVHATWRVRDVLEQRGDDVVIDAQPRPFLGWLGLLGPARFTVTAPAATALDIDTLRATIEVERIVGGGALRTTDGPIRLRGAGGRLAATTVNGPITATGFDGSARLRTTNGPIAVDDSRGGFDLTTVNGPIDLDAELRPGESQRAVTVNGPVRVHLRGAPSLRIDASTVNGAVAAHRPLAASERAGHALSGTIGAGEGELELRTVNGGITID